MGVGFSIPNNYPRENQMQLDDLVKPLESLTVEELEKRLFDIRHRREQSGAGRKNREKKQARKDTTKQVGSVEKLLDGLSPDELAALLSTLEAQK
jgi:hypothetical protein